MKKLLMIILISVSVFPLAVNAQMKEPANTNSVDANALLQKSKRQKTAGWILLGGGVGIATIAAFATEKEHNTTNGGIVFSDKTETLGLLFVLGGASIVGSIPFFIASGKNKRKAEMLLKTEKVFIPEFKSSKIVALGVKINL